MSPAVNSSAYRAVVFDLGGVLVRICHTWREAAVATGISIGLPADDFTRLMTPPALDQYQAGRIDFATYLTDLAAFVRCDPAEAQRLHDGILLEPYLGTDELVAELNAVGLTTACLSNTNASHWNVLIDAAQYPAIAALRHRFASHLEGLSKPDPEIFTRCAEQLGLHPGEIVFFDDTAINVETALDLGFAAFRIDASGDPVSQMRSVLRRLGVLDSRIPV